jgi:hypothetical protein
MVSCGLVVIWASRFLSVSCRLSMLAWLAVVPEREERYGELENRDGSRLFASAPRG